MIRAERYLNVPLAMVARERDKIRRAIELREEPSALLFEADAVDRRPYDVVDGAAVIEIGGVLVHQEDWLSFWLGETGYDRIRAAFDMAIADPAAQAIVFHVNSPGGVVAGCFDLAEHILASRGSKPIAAILDEEAYSAAYALACTADRIIVPKTGGVGSIGVVMMHVDITSALEKLGVKVTTIQYGARKTDSYPTTPLSDEALARFQAEIDVLGEMFVDLVARARGLKPDAIRKTEAACFLGQAGVDAGLADAVMPPQDAFAALVDEID
jgi:signal peptide peptidase SppA